MSKPSKGLLSFQELLRSMNSPYLLLKDGQYIDCNEAAVELVGYPNRASFLNSKVGDLSPHFQPDGKPSADKAKEMMALALEKGAFKCDWTLLRYDKTPIDIEVTFTPLTIDGEDYMSFLWVDCLDAVRQARADAAMKFIQEMGDPYFVLKDGVYTECNQAAVDLLGWPDKHSLLNKGREHFYPLFQPDGANSIEKILEMIEVTRQKGSLTLDWTYKKYDGSPLHTLLMMTFTVVNGEEVLHITWRDISAIKHQQQLVVASEQKYKALFQDSADAMLLFDGESFIDCNDAAVRMLGYKNQDQVRSLHPSAMAPPTQPDGSDSFEKANEIAATAFKQGNHRFEWLATRCNGDCFPVEVLLTVVTVDDRQLIHNVWRDITEKKASEEKIKKLAFEDSLTKLANRETLVRRLTHVLEIYKRTHYKGALLFIDLDHFKNINDTLGHNAGDDLLMQVAKRLTGSVRQGDTVSRFGGDEFVIMLEDLDKDSVQAVNKAETTSLKILDDLNSAYTLNGKKVLVSASIGVTMFTEGSQAKDLLKQADLAMYQAKASGRNAVRFFDPKMQQQVDERAEIEQLITQGLANKQFELHYQLQVDQNGQPLGVEGLLRLKHPEKGYIPPMQYIQVAEETGSIIQIGLWVLETACEQLKRWEESPYTDKLTIAVNVSPMEFNQASFVAQIPR